jgi:hypothetical protein
LFFAAHRLDRWEPEHVIFMLANVFNGSAGVALFATLLLEVGRAMVLFYPALKRKIFEEGRREGREEGRREGRKEWEAWNQRREQALANNQSFDEPPPSRNQGDKA